MMFPLYAGEVFGYEAGLVVGVLVGIAFGFVLERSGFGQAPVLAAQFYASDNRVLKVMFTAIVTALLGMTVLAGVGLLDLSALQVPDSVLIAQVVGGLLLGVGFIVSGYCPGTSVVAAASGNIDGWITILGVSVGGLVFGVFYPYVDGLYDMGQLGVLRFPDLLGIPQAILAAGVTAMAIGAFLFAEWGERVLGAKRGEEPPVSEPARRNRVFVGFGVATALGLATLALPASAPASATAAWSPIPALDLARALVESPESVSLVDARDPSACAAARIPGAACLPAGDDGAALLAGLPPTRTLVLYGAGDLATLPDGAARFGGEIRVLAGGFPAFQAAVLAKPDAPGENATPAALRDYALRTALFNHFTGAKVQVQAPVPAARPVERAAKKGGGC
jgi:hypothetical protein